MRKYRIVKKTYPSTGGSYDRFEVQRKILGIWFNVFDDDFNSFEYAEKLIKVLATKSKKEVVSIYEFRKGGGTIHNEK